jgi:hypothetical protein
LAAAVRQESVDLEAARGAYEEAKQLAPGEPEPDLLFGLALVKSKQRDEALRHFQVLRIERPELLLPLEAMAWVRFEKRSYPAGIEDLVELVGKLPRPETPAEPLSEVSQRVLPWAGRLREFAGTAVKGSRQPSGPALERLDDAVAALGDASELAYRKGRNQASTVRMEFDTRIQDAGDEATELRLGIERRNLAYYARFPVAEHVAEILAGLDQ